MTLQACVLSPLHTKSSIFPSSSARDHVTAEEKKTAVMFASSVDSGAPTIKLYNVLKNSPFSSVAPFSCSWHELTCNQAFWAQFPTQETTFSSRSISNPVRSWACNHSHSWLVENYQLTSNRQMNGPCTSTCHTSHSSPWMWQVSLIWNILR